jgi:hypothetical protein
MPTRNHPKFRSLVPVVLLLVLVQSSRTSPSAAAIGAPGGARLRRGQEESSVSSLSPYHHRVLQEPAPDNASSSSYYVADYVGRFHYARHDRLCTGPPPDLIASCPLGGRIELVKVSHPDYILCEYANDDATANPKNATATTTTSSSQLRCRTICLTVAACSTVFLAASELPNVYNGPYGEVNFRCIGNENPLQTTTGSFTYVGSDKDNLATTTGGCSQYPTKIDTWNARVAQLGTFVFVFSASSSSLMFSTTLALVQISSTHTNHPKFFIIIPQACSAPATMAPTLFMSTTTITLNANWSARRYP